MNSTGPPPPTSVLVMGLSPLTPHQHIRRHFAVHGNITSFEPQIDKVNGAALGIVLIGYSSHENAKKCVEKEHGKKPTTATGLGAPGVDSEEIKVVFDGEGKKLKAVLKELDDRRRHEREEKRRKEKGEKLKEANAALKNTPSTSAGQTPQSSTPWRPGQQAPPQRQQSNGSRPQQGTHLPLPPNSRAHGSNSNSPVPPIGGASQAKGTPADPPPARIRRPPLALVKARLASARAVSSSTHRPPRSSLHPSDSSSATPVYPRPRHTSRFSDDRHGRSPSPVSRSPSPVLRKPGQSSRNARQKEHEAVVEELARNGFEHVSIDGHGAQLSGAVREEDVRQFFDGFKVDKVSFRCSSGI